MTNPPIINSPSSVTIPATIAIAIKNLSVSDAFAAGNTGTMNLTVSCLSGSLVMKLNGVNVAGSGTKTIVLNETFVNVNLALSTLVYQCSTSVTKDTITIVVWNQAGLNTTKTISLSTTAPTPPIVNGVQATRARTLSSMLAINTHLDFGTWGLTPQYANLTQVAASINYIWQNSGVTPFLRDWPAISETSWLTINQATKAKFIASIGENTPDQYQTFVNNALAMASIILYLDGPNEEDSAAANGLTNGVDAVTSLNNAAAYMPTLWNIGQQHNLPVINMSYGQGWGTSYDPNYQHGYYGINGDLSPYCNFGNAHTYPQNGDPPHDNMMMLNTAAKRAALSRPVAITEFGYTLGSGGASVAEDVHAKYCLAGLMDAFILGNVIYGWYALYDDMSGNWGLFNADYSPRMAGKALRNFLTVLADIGNTALTFSPAKLNYTASACSQALFQKSNGEFNLVLWNEQKISSGQNPQISVTLNIGMTKNVQIFDPIFGTTPILSYLNVSSVVVQVPAYPIILRIY